MLTRLEILSNIPETLPPEEYAELLPRVEDGEVVDYHQESLREPDWCETSARDPTPPLTPALLSQWYQSRACDIEQKSRLVDHALRFVELGMKNGVKVGICQCLCALLDALLSHNTFYLRHLFQTW